MNLKTKLLLGVFITSVFLTISSIVVGVVMIYSRNNEAKKESSGGFVVSISPTPEIQQNIVAKSDDGSVVNIENVTPTPTNFIIKPISGSALSLAEVATHNTTSNCWIVISNGVYAVSSFLNLHPGGAMVISKYCGKDATKGFGTKDETPASVHSDTAKKMLANYFLGNLGGSTNGNVNRTATNPVIVTNSTPFPTITQTTSNNNTSGGSANILSVSDVATHNTTSNCWLMISNNVYDVTGFLTSHPGGVAVITKYCGKDATNAFNTKDKNPGSGHSTYAQNLLGNYLVGKIGSAVSSPNTPVATQTPVSTNTPQPTTRPGVNPTSTPVATSVPAGQTITSATVATHNTTSNCWLIISNKVYNVTSFIVAHPGGVAAIQAYCGKEATNAFQTKGGKGSNHSNNAYNMLAQYLVGTLGSVAVNPTAMPVPPTSAPGSQTPTGVPTSVPNNPTATPTSNGSSCTLPAAVCAKYPTAKLSGSINTEDDGRSQFKITVNGQCRDIMLNAAGQITSDKAC